MKKKLLIGLTLIIVASLIVVFVILSQKDSDTIEPVVESTANNLVEEQIDEPEINLPEEIPEVVIEPLKQIWVFEDQDPGSWTTEIPYINPFNTEAAYDVVEYLPNDSYTFEYVDATAKLIYREVYGPSWVLKFPFEEALTDQDNLQLLYDIKPYMSKKNSTLLGRYYDAVTYESIQDGVHWFTELRAYDDEFVLTISKENVLKKDELYIIHPGDYEDNETYITSYESGLEYKSLTLTKDSGEFSIRANTDHTFGEYRRRYDQYNYYEENFGDVFHLNELPYDAGYVQWTVEWDEDDMPNEITLYLESLGSIAEVKHGEALGAIKVSAEYVSTIKAYPSGYDYLSIDHPEYEYDQNDLDTTPDGDHIIYLPSGLWNVVIEPSGSALVSQYETLMVPVNTGQVTEVVIPNSVSTTLKVSSGFQERGLEIRDIIEAENEVTFRFTLLDDTTKSILPNLENTVIFEGGIETDIIAINPVDIPPSIVLLLDSSGSMKGQMDATVEAAKIFVSSLPEYTKIQVIDFDTKPKLLDGMSKEAVLESLSTVKVGGATTLYDAIIMGTNLLTPEERPTLVVFTDGEDANLNDTDRGSEATLEEAIDSVSSVNIPLYTIGFGENHDVKTLETFADLTEGKYYSAKDQDVLNAVFNAINNKITNTYDVTYQRPTQTSVSDIPVVSIVVDTSGSMNEYVETGGYRLLNVQELLHDFVKALPEETQLQVTEFNNGTSIIQTITTEKPLIMRAIARMRAGGGTDIEGSVEATYKTLAKVPSSKKVMVYITDAALGTTGASDNFLKILEDVGKSDITVLWVGMGVDEYEEDFILAAELSDGDYVISEDSEILAEKFDAILNEVLDEPKSELVNVHLSVEKMNNLGEREVYSTSQLTELQPKEISDEVIITEAIQYRFSDVVQQYDEKTAAKISGPTIPGREIIIKNRMDANQENHNEAANIHVKEIFTIEKVDGVVAPSGYKFISLEVEITNILPEKEVMVYPDNSAHPSAWVAGGNQGKLEMKKIAYMIPNFVSHMYLNYNDVHTLPASTATWLLEKPLVTPGNYSLTVQPDETIDGMLTFVVPDEVLNQMSLHFYDTNYGHIDVPLVGIMTNPMVIEELPLVASTNLTDTFGLAIIDYEFMENINDNVPVVEDSILKLVKGNFTSEMQALIDINPAERMQMRIKTDSGDFYIPINPATVLIPGGFYQPRMMAPGANNLIKWVFQVPKILKDHESEIFVDLYDEDKTLLINDGARLAVNQSLKYEHEYFDLIVNDLAQVTGFKDYYNDYIIADITVVDKKDGFSTSGITEYLSIVRDEYFDVEGGDQTEASVSLGSFNSGDGKYKVSYYDLSDTMLLGMGEDTVIYDGTSRRGFMVFSIPSDGVDADWYLYSSELTDLLLSPNSSTFDDALAIDEIIFEGDYTYEESFSEALSRAIEHYEMTHPAENEGLNEGVIAFDEASAKKEIPVPMISSYGTELLEEIDDVEKLIATLKQIKCIPSNGASDPFEYYFSPEAFLVQGYGTEQDFANTSVRVLSQLGYSVKLQTLALTERGEEVFKEQTGFDNIRTEEIPGLSFNYKGEDRILILPFMLFSDEVEDLVYIKNATNDELSSHNVRLSITLHGEYTEKGMLKTFSDLTDALSGETEVDNSIAVEMFSDSLPTDLLSLDAIDFGIGVSAQTARAYVSTANGEYLGDEIINPNHYEFDKMVVEFITPDGSTFEHISEYTEGMTVDQIFLTASINAPDLDEKATEYLSVLSDKVYQLAENPDELSSLRWYGRSMLAEFIQKQTIYEQELADVLDLLIGRINIPRIIVVSTKNNNGVINTNMDLVQPYNEVFIGDEINTNSYHIMSGLYASTLEGDVINNGYGVEDVWAKLPESAEFLFIEGNMSSDSIEMLNEIGMDPDIIDYMSESDQYFVIPSVPADMNGEKRWAWLELDPDNYKTIGVLDDYSHGASVESAIIDAVTSAGQFAVGAFKGVETSIWSVAAFSLEESDYEVILKKAKAFTLGLVNGFGVKEGPVSASIGGTFSVSQSVGPFNFSFNGSFDMSQGVLGYSEGFVEGVKLYFDIAK